MPKHIKEKVDFSIKREKVLNEESDEVRRISPNRNDVTVETVTILLMNILSPRRY